MAEFFDSLVTTRQPHLRVADDGEVATASLVLAIPPDSADPRSSSVHAVRAGDEVGRAYRLSGSGRCHNDGTFGGDHGRARQQHSQPPRQPMSRRNVVLVSSQEEGEGSVVGGSADGMEPVADDDDELDPVSDDDDDDDALDLHAGVLDMDM